MYCMRSTKTKVLCLSLPSNSSTNLLIFANDFENPLEIDMLRFLLLYCVYVGFEILAFPCNQFGGQEPGSNKEIQETVCTRFKAEFPIFDKVIGNEKKAQRNFFMVHSHFSLSDFTILFYISLLIPSSYAPLVAFITKLHRCHNLRTA